MTERLRGRRGVEQRLRRLRAQPLCVDCLAEARVTASTTPDHIVPLSMGGTDTDDNIRCLCAEHHRVRTNEQFGYVRTITGADGWPIHLQTKQHWSTEVIERRMPSDLKVSLIPLTMVCGPPGSGKSTYVNKHKKPSHLVIDLDAIQQSLSGLPPHHTSRRWLEPSLNERNRLLRSLSDPNILVHDAAWFIIAAPDATERSTWAKRLGANVVLMTTPLEECIRRINADPTRLKHRERMIDAVKKWYQHGEVRMTE